MVQPLLVPKNVNSTTPSVVLDGCSGDRLGFPTLFPRRHLLRRHHHRGRRHRGASSQSAGKSGRRGTGISAVRRPGPPARGVRLPETDTAYAAASVESLVADWFSAMRYNDQFPVFDG